MKFEKRSYRNYTINSERLRRKFCLMFCIFVNTENNNFLQIDLFLKQIKHKKKLENIETGKIIETKKRRNIIEKKKRKRL